MTKRKRTRRQRAEAANRRKQERVADALAGAPSAPEEKYALDNTLADAGTVLLAWGKGIRHNLFAARNESAAWRVKRVDLEACAMALFHYKKHKEPAAGYMNGWGCLFDESVLFEWLQLKFADAYQLRRLAKEELADFKSVLPATGLYLVFSTTDRNIMGVPKTQELRKIAVVDCSDEPK
eukprot:gb/GEZN01015195.1/.p1 GENE.gb/GEZN01015195.1/~~gb/GEZN01015195.1/.p1  ORF type:complete len:180 (-),score=38.12 gb/GEZN01015195.1/:261-800(-)